MLETSKDLVSDVVQEVYQPYVGWDVGRRKPLYYLKVSSHHTTILPEVRVKNRSHLGIQGDKENNQIKQAIDISNALRIKGLQHLVLKDMSLKASQAWNVALLQKVCLHRMKLASLPSFASTLRVLELRQTCLESRDNTESILVGLCEQDLPNLVTLVITDCRQSGQIPVGISKFNKLVELDLSGNLLSGTIPTTLGDLTSLESLNLSHNCLEGTIPTELEKLTCLDELVLAHNQLEGQVPLVCANSWFCLAHNKFCGVFPDIKSEHVHTEGNLFDNQVDLQERDMRSYLEESCCYE
jgi:Leucine-rich repeat (LRR) protein